MKTYKIMAADIDGTLRGRKRKEIGPVTTEAFRKLHEKGVLIGIASGRPLWQGVSQHAQEWNLGFEFDYLIGMNGSELFDAHTGKKEEFYSLSCDTLHEIVGKMHDLDLNPFVYRDGYMLSLKEDDEMLASAHRHMGGFKIAKDESELYAEPTAKILYRCGTNKRRIKAEEYARSICTDRYTVFATGPTLIEFQDPRINKGVALKRYCEEQGLSIEDAMAFGDAENDLQMLKIAGWSVCVKDGMDNVKVVSNDLTYLDCDEDGVGDYILKNIDHFTSAK